MPKFVRPEIVLAMGLNASARALGIPLARIHEGIEDGRLEARTCGRKQRIAVFGPKGLQSFYETWPLAPPRKVPKGITIMVPGPQDPRIAAFNKTKGL